MNLKTTLMILTCLIIVSTMIVPQTVVSNAENSNVMDNFRLINFNTETVVEIDKKDIPDETPLTLNETINLDLVVKFKFEKPWFIPTFLLNTGIGKWILFRDKNANMTVNLSLSVESPDWVDAELGQQQINFDLNTEFQENQVKLSLTPSKNAPALQKTDIKIKASFTPIETWGLIESDNESSFNITAEYEPLIKHDFAVNLTDSTVLITPGEINLIPLNLSNQGNGELTKISLNVTNVTQDKGWNISFEPASVNVENDEIKSVVLKVYAPKNFDRETIELTFTPELISDADITEEQYLKPGSKTIEITLENDGSLKTEENGLLELDNLLIAIIFLIILAIAIIIIATVWLKNRQK